MEVVGVDKFQRPGGRVARSGGPCNVGGASGGEVGRGVNRQSVDERKDDGEYAA